MPVAAGINASPAALLCPRLSCLYIIPFTSPTRPRPPPKLQPYQHSLPPPKPPTPPKCSSRPPSSPPSRPSPLLTTATTTAPTPPVAGPPRPRASPAPRPPPLRPPPPPRPTPPPRSTPRPPPTTATTPPPSTAPPRPSSPRSPPPPSRRLPPPPRLRPPSRVVLASPRLLWLPSVLRLLLGFFRGSSWEKGDWDSGWRLDWTACLVGWFGLGDADGRWVWMHPVIPSYSLDNLMINVARRLSRAQCFSWFCSPDAYILLQCRFP
ncbi:hypothetical protein QBC39DRAFT_136495 [Podospora conica]|nr:hypothetical protein QBC39DRAFT_136495 [Schizothecium conicum]